MTSAPPARSGRPARSPLARARSRPDFVWGAATAAYQIEGAVDERRPRRRRSGTPSPASPAGSRNGDTGAGRVRPLPPLAARTSTLMRELGLARVPVLAVLAADPARRAAAVRTAPGWTSTTGSSTGCSRAGIDALGDALPLGPAAGARGRRRLAGPGHRLPVRRVRRGRRPSALGDRVQHWITLNEPWCSAFLGLRLRAARARARPTGAAAVAAAHHLLLGHGLAVEAIRAGAPAAQVGITLNLYPVTPADDRPGVASTRPAGSTACRTAGSSTRCSAARYPADVVADLGPRRSTSAWSATATWRRSPTPLDFLGVNYYTRHIVRGSAVPGQQPTSSSSAAAWPRTANGLGGRPRRA